MKFSSIFYSNHAIQRIFERGISLDEIEAAVESSHVIMEYPDDRPFPSFLILGITMSRPLHVVVGIDINKKICYVITVYQPDPESWSDDYTVRR